MNGAAAVPIVALVTHARQVPALERERSAAALHRELAGRALVLETGHCVEAYLGNANDAARLAPALPAGGHALSGKQAVHHAMTVAVGPDSVVVGDTADEPQLKRSSSMRIASASRSSRRYGSGFPIWSHRPARRSRQ
jgi:glutamyl-tRNA reductase